MVVRGNTEERGWLLENVSSTTSCRIVYLKLLPPVVCQHGSVEEVDPWVDPDADTDSNVYRIDFEGRELSFILNPRGLSFTRCNCVAQPMSICGERLEQGLNDDFCK